MKLFYFNDIKNFGDVLSSDLLIKLLGQKINHANVSGCELVAIGSLLDTFLVEKKSYIKRLKGLMRPRVKVWGTGFICKESESKIYLQRKLEIYAVRGQISLDRLTKLKGDCYIRSDVVLGDPGLLATYILGKEIIEKKYKIGIVAHYADKNNPVLKKVNCSDYRLIDICQDPINFLREISSCETIISSAMHGLIAADSLGIPNIRMRLSDNIVGGDYKFNDYYSALGIYNHPCLAVGSNFDWYGLDRTIIANYCVDKEIVANVKSGLLKAFHQVKKDI